MKIFLKAFKPTITKSVGLLLSGLSLYYVEKALSTPNNVGHQISPTLFNLLVNLRILIFKTFDSFIYFLIAILTLESLAAFLKILRKTKESHPEDVVINQKQKAKKNTLVTASGLIFCCFLIFYFSKLFLICTTFLSFPQNEASTVIEFPTHHQLQEDYNNDNERRRMLSPVIPSLSDRIFFLNRLTSSVSLSKDGNIAYIGLFEALEIYNVSNPRIPVLISGTPVAENLKGARPQVMSQDEKLLVFGGYHSLELYDISDLKAPKFLNDLTVKDKNNNPTFILSEDNQILFISTTSGLNIYNISDPKSELSQNIIYSTTEPTEIAVAHKAKILLLAHETNLEILDMTNLASPTPVASLPLSGEIVHIKLSADERTAYVCILGQKISVQIIDISDPQKPKSVTTVPLAPNHQVTETLHPRLILSPNGKLLTLSNFYGLFSLRLSTLEVVSLNPDFDQSRVRSIAISPNNQFALISAGNQLVILKLYIDISSNQRFPLKLNIITNDTSLKIYQSIKVTPDGKKAIFIGNYGPSLFESTIFLNIYDISNLGAPKPLAQYSLQKYSDLLGSYKAMLLRQQFAFFQGFQKILIVNLEDSNSPSYTVVEVAYLNGFTASSDGRTLFTVNNLWFSAPELHIYDISRLPSSTLLTSFLLPKGKNLYVALQLSQDDKTLFLVQEQLIILDVSSSSSPIILSSMALNHEKEAYPLLTVSPHEDIIFVGVSTKEQQLLNIIDVSNRKAPVLISTVDFGIIEFLNSLQLSSDQKVLYVNSNIGIFIVDVQQISTPTISGYLPHETDSFTLAHDENHLITNSKGFEVLSLLPKYTLFVENPKYGLGSSHFLNLKTLTLLSSNNYACFEQNHKFTKLSLYEVSPFPKNFKVPINYPSLPSWMTFDRENAIIRIEPKSHSHLGTYNLFAVASIEIAPNAFANIPEINNLENSLDLRAHLVGQGYIDSEGFITPSFDPNIALILSSKYSKIESSIRSILKENLIEMMTQIYIHSTLNLESEKNISIETPSTTPITVSIELWSDNKDVKPQFVNQAYTSIKSTIANHKTFLLIEGLLKDVNKALSSIILDIDHGAPCNGKLSIIDNLNPPFTQNVLNISRHFRLNQYPIYSGSAKNASLLLENQLKRAQIYTGQFFTFEFNPSTFRDSLGLPLEYHLSMQNNHTEMPSWLSLKDLTLTGTPPEKLSELSLKLSIAASNEFRRIEIPFVLETKISLFFALKMLFSYITLVGLWIYAYKIYNVLGKKYYRHPKEFSVHIGQEITENVIFPLYFLRDEAREASFLLKHLEKFVAKKPEVQGKSFVHQYFFANHHQRQLDKAQIRQAIEDVVMSFPENQNENVPLFLQESSKKELICELIIQEILMKQLNTKEEKETRKIFEKIKSHWYDLVSKGPESPLQFKINQNAFEQKLLQALPKSKNSNYHALDTHESSLNISMQNIHPSSPLKESPNQTLVQTAAQSLGINLRLLEDSICVHATRQQNIERYLIQTEIIPRLKAHPKVFRPCIRSIMRFLNLDSSLMTHARKGKLGFGIKYKFDNEILYFYGTPKTELRNNTLIVQLKTIRGKILKEILIKANGKSQEQKEERLIINEIQETL